MRVSGAWPVCVGWLPARAANCSNPRPLNVSTSMSMFGQTFGFLCWLPNVRELSGYRCSFAEHPRGCEANHVGVLAAHLESLLRLDDGP